METDKRPIESLLQGVYDLKSTRESCMVGSEQCSSAIKRIEHALSHMQKEYLVSLADLDLRQAIETVSRSFGSVGLEGGKIETTTAGLQHVIDRLCTLSMRDGLTGLYNQRYFRLQIQVEIKRASRFEQPLALIMMDIDHFKRVNDTYGHPFGDEVLKGFADVLKSHLRLSDLSVRYGGEEFAILLPNTNIEQAYFVAEKLRDEIGETAFMCGDDPVHITVSVGLAQFQHSGTETIDAFIKRADDLLYRAKTTGRNQVVCDQTDMDAVRHGEVSCNERRKLFDVLNDVGYTEGQE